MLSQIKLCGLGFVGVFLWGGEAGNRKHIFLSSLKAGAGRLSLTHRQEVQSRRLYSAKNPHLPQWGLCLNGQWAINAGALQKEIRGVWKAL